MLHTRLPFPSEWRSKRRSGAGGIVTERDTDASVFIGGIDQALPTAFDWSLGAQFDEAVSDRLSKAALTSLADWYGERPPTRVSVMGISETGTFLRGKSSRTAIHDFARACQMPQVTAAH